MQNEYLEGEGQQDMTEIMADLLTDDYDIDKIKNKKYHNIGTSQKKNANLIHLTHRIAHSLGLVHILQQKVAELNLFYM